MKKLLSVLIAMIMIVSMASVSFATELPIVSADSGIEFTIVVARNAQQYCSYDELPFWQMIQEKTGIKINWIEIPSTSVTEKVNLMLAGGDDLPDAFMWCVNNDMLANYYDQDVFICVDDYLQDMPNLTSIYEARPAYKSLATLPDGHMYGFPYIEEMYGLVLTPGPFYINKTWLDACGLEIPTTVEEFKNALIAFRDAGDLNGNGIDDEIPYTLDFGNTNAYGSYDTFYAFCNAFGSPSTAGGNRANDYLTIVDGEVVFSAQTEAWRKTCNYFHELYSEGLIDIGSFAPGADRSVAPYTSVISSSDVAIYGAFGMWNVNTYMKDEDVLAQYVALPRLTGEDGRKTGTVLNMSEMQWASAVAITTECEHPEILVQLIDYIYSPEISVQANNGMAGYVMMYDENGCLRENFDENGNIIYPEGSGWSSTNDARYNTRGSKMASAVLNEYYDVLVSYDYGAKPVLSGQQGNGKEEVLAELTAYPAVLLSSEESAVVSQIQSNIRTIVESYRIDSIMNGTADANWESYLAQLNAAGLEQMLEVYRTAYARYLSNK